MTFLSSSLTCPATQCGLPQLRCEWSRHCPFIGESWNASARHEGLAVHLRLRVAFSDSGNGRTDSAGIYFRRGAYWFEWIELSRSSGRASASIRTSIKLGLVGL